MARGTLPYKQNRLQQLRGFYYAAQMGSISKAAERMDLTQPAVSLQIQALEREFHTALFERHGPRIQLTPDGAVLYALASSLVERMDSLHEAFAARREQVAGGVVRIAAGQSTLLYLLPEFVAEFSKRYPQVELKLHAVPGRAGLQMLRDGDVELAVGPLMEAPEDLRYYPLFEYESLLITPRRHPLAGKRSVSLKTLSAYPLILPPRNLTTFRLVDAAFRQQGLAYDVRVEVGGWDVIKRHVELDVGVAVVSSICMTGRERLWSVPMSRYLPKRTYGVVLRRGRFLSAATRRFLEIIAPDVDWETELS